MNPLPLRRRSGITSPWSATGSGRRPTTGRSGSACAPGTSSRTSAAGPACSRSSRHGRARAASTRSRPARPSSWRSIWRARTTWPTGSSSSTTSPSTSSSLSPSTSWSPRRCGTSGSGKGSSAACSTRAVPARGRDDRPRMGGARGRARGERRAARRARDLARGRLGIDLTSIRTFAANTARSRTIDPESLLGDPVALSRVRPRRGKRARVRGGGLAGGLQERDGRRARRMVSRGPLPRRGPVQRAAAPDAELVARAVPCSRSRSRSRRETASRSGSVRPGTGALWSWRVAHEPSGADVPGDVREHSSFRGSRCRSISFTPPRRRRTCARRVAEPPRTSSELLAAERSVAAIEGEVLRRFPHVVSSRQSAAALVHEVISRCA